MTDILGPSLFDIPRGRIVSSMALMQRSREWQLTQKPYSRRSLRRPPRHSDSPKDIPQGDQSICLLSLGLSAAEEQNDRSLAWRFSAAQHLFGITYFSTAPICRAEEDSVTIIPYDCFDPQNPAAPTRRAARQSPRQ